MEFTGRLGVIELVIMLIYALFLGLGVYILYLVIKALNIYIRKNS